MSRAVPMDAPLSDEDRRYLRMNGANGANIEDRIDQAYPPDPEELEEFNKEERQKLAELNGVGLNAVDQAGLLEENARLKAELEALRGKDSPPPEDYSGWNKGDLEKEIDRINKEDEEAKLPKGTVKEMQAVLREYFAE